MILFSHPTGNANVRAALTGLLVAGILKEFHTSIALYSGNLWDVLANNRWGQELKRRGFDDRLEPLTVQHPFRELGRILANRLKFYHLSQHETGIFCVDAIYRTLDNIAARCLQTNPKAYTGVYLYEDGAWEAFRTAHQLGIRRFYDLPIAFWELKSQLLHEEEQRLPAWEQTLGGMHDSEAKLARKTEELALADVVICPSQFVADSLPEKTRLTKKVVITHFGSPAAAPSKPRETLTSGKKLRVLFAGSMSQRKGLGDLLAAVRMLNRDDVELVVMGSLLAPLDFYRGQYSKFTYEPPRPHAAVLKLMNSCDVFCLPSIVEGRALVMQEAMSQGLPLIITPNTGGSDLIDEGVTGFLVPIRQPEQIAAKIAWFADNRSAIPEMSQAAQVKAAAYTWESYGRAVVNAVS